MKFHDQETSENRESTGRGFADALLVSVCIGLLLCLGIMLRPQQRGPHHVPAVPDMDVPVNPEDSDGPRERLMSLGFALLLVSLGVCLYTMYRLGFCCLRREYNHSRLRRGIPSVNSRLHLMSASDLPPAYDAIMLSTSRSTESQPPSYFTIVIHDDKATPGPCAAPSAAPRVHCCAAGVAEAASRPQEAG